MLHRTPPQNVRPLPPSAGRVLGLVRVPPPDLLQEGDFHYLSEREKSRWEPKGM